jgi:predicted ATPase
MVPALFAAHTDSIEGEVRFGQFCLNCRTSELSYRGAIQVLLQDECTVMRLAIAAAGSPVPEATLLLASGMLDAVDGADQLWSCVTRLNQSLESCSSGYGYIAHFPHVGFALVVPRNVARGTFGLPQQSKAVIGRDDIAERIRSKLGQHRFVTIVGAGGIGKTTVAAMVATRLAAEFPDGVCFIDASPLAEPRLLPNALAQALGVAVAAGGVLACLSAFLRYKKVLVILDSCEHLIGAAADLAEHLLGAASQLVLLATSREPLMASGEWLLRLGAIGLPPLSGNLCGAQALEYPAVQLFVERARQHITNYVLDDDSAGKVSALCHRLDGIPLAIELAAARLPLLGLGALLEQVEYRLLAGDSSIRSAKGRHETLGAMLDWSYDLLPQNQQRALIRLSVFRGEFTLAAAVSVLTGDDEASRHDSAECVIELLMKSLLSAREDGAAYRYRLLDTTRGYAAAKLDALGERRQQQTRHARYLCTLMHAAEEDWLVLPREQWLNTYRMWIDDIRVALDWTLAPGEDAELGAALVLATFPLGHQASLTAEFSDRVAHALTVVEPSGLTATLLQIQQYSLTCNMKSFLDPRNCSLVAAVHAVEHADANSALVKYRTSLRASVWAASFIPGDFPAALQQVESMREQAEAEGDWLADITARRMQAQSLHFLGRHAEAQVQAEFVLANAWRRIPLVGSPAQLDVRVSMRIVLARVAFMSGNLAQAAQLSSDALEYAAGDTAAAQAQALALCAIPIAFWTGDHLAAQQLVRRLNEHAQSYSLPMWAGWAHIYRQVIASLEGDEVALAELLSSSGNSLDHTQRDHLVTFGMQLLAPDSVERVESGTVGWCTAELLRAQAERHVARGEHAAGSPLLFRALETARAQGALSWELRAATSLASLWQGQNRGAAGRALLEPLMARFSDSTDFADLRRAHQVLSKC